MAFFFCDYKNSATHSVHAILGSLLKQFALQHDHCLDLLEKFHGNHNPKHGLVQKATAVDMKKLLLSMMKMFARTFILIDGLDEIMSNRLETIEFLQHLNTESDKNTNMLFASRDEIDIRDSLPNFSSISIAAQTQDLRLYVAAEMNLRQERKQLEIQDPELTGHIMKILITGAQGM